MVIAGIVAGIGPLILVAGILSTALATISAPMIAVIAGAAALSAGITFLSTKTNFFQDILKNAKSKLCEFGDKFKSIGGNMSIIAEAMKKAFEFGDMSVRFDHTVIIENKNKSNTENNTNEKIN